MTVDRQARRQRIASWSESPPLFQRDAVLGWDIDHELGKTALDPADQAEPNVLFRLGALRAETLDVHTLRRQEFRVKRAVVAVEFADGPAGWPMNCAVRRHWAGHPCARHGRQVVLIGECGHAKRSSPSQDALTRALSFQCFECREIRLGCPCRSCDPTNP